MSTLDTPEALQEYREKRHFERTPELRPGAPEHTSDALTFVVQKHAASRLHYDFRLELDGVLKSWAVPKGPSLDPRQKRLAVMVEDHPLDYGSFEGTIPAGEYGGGQVIVWDRGTYVPEGANVTRSDQERHAREGLARGRMSFVLHGHKLQGGWSLAKMQRGDDQWLLIKERDAFADASRDVLADGRSVISGAEIRKVTTTAKQP